MIRAGTETRKWWALGGITLAVLAVTLDATILSVALPTLAGVFHASETDLQWFSSGYLLVLAAAMLPAGLLGDRYGRKKVLLASLLLFGAGSAACAYAPSAGAFIAARVLLGVAGAGTVVMAISAVTVLFTEEERPRAVGIWGAANFLAFPIGPILGGWLLSHYWWGWVFLINVPVALVGLLAALALVPESRAAQRPALDPVGTVASIAGLVALTYGLIEAGQHGWTDSGALGAMLAGLAVLLGFFLWEHRLLRQPGGQPLVDLALFRSRSFTWGLVLTATAMMAMIGVLFTLPQYSQAVLGSDAMGSGLRLLPLVGGLLIGIVPAVALLRLVGAKLTAACGFAVMAAGLLLGATTALNSGQEFILEWSAVVGFGLGLAFATTASAAIAKLPQERSGVGAAVFQALQKVGGPFGAAVLGSVLASAYQAELHLGGLPPAVAKVVQDSVFGGLAVAGQVRSAALAESVRAAFVHGMDAALLASAGITLVGVVLALAFLPGGSSAIDAGRERGRKGGPSAVAG